MSRGAIISLVVVFDLAFICALIAAIAPETVVRWIGSEVTVSQTTLWSTVVLAGVISAALTAMAISKAKS